MVVASLVIPIWWRFYQQAWEKMSGGTNRAGPNISGAQCKKKNEAFPYIHKLSKVNTQHQSDWFPFCCFYKKIYAFFMTSQHRSKKTQALEELVNLLKSWNKDIRSRDCLPSAFFLDRRQPSRWPWRPRAGRWTHAALGVAAANFLFLLQLTSSSTIFLSLVKPMGNEGEWI